ncbi:MAG: hypothetical protein R3F60_27685 [bacterium]
MQHKILMPNRLSWVMKGALVALLAFTGCDDGEAAEAPAAQEAAVRTLAAGAPGDALPAAPPPRSAIRCAGGEACVFADGACSCVTACNSAAPTCTPGCGATRSAARPAPASRAGARPTRPSAAPGATMAAATGVQQQLRLRGQPAPAAGQPAAAPQPLVGGGHQPG